MENKTNYDKKLCINCKYNIIITANFCPKCGKNQNQNNLCLNVYCKK